MGLFAYLSIAFFGFLESPSALPSPSLDVASTVRYVDVCTLFSVLLNLYDTKLQRNLAI